MMSAPVRRDKDAVFKHKRVAETKGRSAICGPLGASITNGRCLPLSDEPISPYVHDFHTGHPTPCRGAV